MTVREIKAAERLRLMESGHVFKDCSVLYQDGRLEKVQRIFLDYNGKIRIDHKCKPQMTCYTRFCPEDILGNNPKITIVD